MALAAPRGVRTVPLPFISRSSYDGSLYNLSGVCRLLPIEFMQRTLQLAEKGSGYTSPNPNVGAVLVKDGRVIGEGYHSRHGEGHAEVVAIQNSPEAVRGADLYCNLEPCCHDIPSKRTPPCTQRIIQEGIGRIYISTIDPNPHVNGNGVARLQEAGIPVTAGLLAGEARRLNEVYFRFIQSRLPFVHLKMRRPLDQR